MSDTVPLFPRREIREALARHTYLRNEVRIADPDLTGFTWLVASPHGVFAVSWETAKTVIFGRFFGICRHERSLYLFETCGSRGGADRMGRIIRFGLDEGCLGAPAVLATGLDDNCHQLAVIDGYLCVVDTANQAILRYTLEGEPVDIKRPFPAARPDDRSGAYLHLNAIAKVGDRIGLMLHNGRALPEKTSELAWLDAGWEVCERLSLPGYSCHDIVEDERGVLWHSASMSGEIMSSEGARMLITGEMMTRGISITPDAIVVGMSTFGPRHVRDKLRGAVVILDRDLNRLTEITLSGAPTDIIAL